jgi:hypothetical protein
MFWTFRIMVALGFAMLLLFGLALLVLGEGRFRRQAPWLLRWALWFLPLPWIACETGLVRGRVRPPALDHLRRAAHPPVGVHAERGTACTARWPASSASTPCCWWSRCT